MKNLKLVWLISTLFATLCFCVGAGIQVASIFLGVWTLFCAGVYIIHKTAEGI